MSITIRKAQQDVKRFAKRNGWKDAPNIDLLDHIHEELIEISQYLRYKSEPERIAYVKKHQEYFVSEAGDLLFGVCRLANQLNVDLEKGFSRTHKKALAKYQPGKERNVPSKKKTPSGRRG